MSWKAKAGRDSFKCEHAKGSLEIMTKHHFLKPKIILMETAFPPALPVNQTTQQKTKDKSVAQKL